MVLGKTIRYNKFFGKGGNALFVAVDHGAQFGPLDNLLDVCDALEKIHMVDGILMNPGILDQASPFFAKKDTPPLILRVTWTSAYCFPWNYKEAHTCRVMHPYDALYSGAEMVTACCVLQSGSESTDRDNVKLFSEIAAEKEKAGIPLIGELYPMQAENLPPDELHNRVYRGARILAELGADVIKTFYTGERFSEVVEAVPVPILVLGASKTEHEESALEMARKAMAAGARGIVFGRNAFQAEDVHGFIQALANIVHMKGEQKKAPELMSTSAS